MKSDWQQSFVAAIPLLSDTSQVSRRSGALSFHPLHIMALKFLETSRREQRIKNRMLMAYLAVFYDSTSVLRPGTIVFRKVMDAPNICNLFTKAYSVLWENVFPLHFLDLWPPHQMKTNFLYTVRKHPTLQIFPNLKICSAWNLGKYPRWHTTDVKQQKNLHWQKNGKGET